MNYIILDTINLFLQLSAVTMIGAGVYGLIFEKKEACKHENYKTDRIRIEGKLHYQYTCNDCTHVWNKKAGRPNKKEVQN